MEAVLIVAIVIGLIPAAVASGKGRNFIVWWIYGALIFIIALPHALMLTKDTTTLERRALSEGALKRCPLCAELIKIEATVCRHCGRSVPTRTANAPIPLATSQYRVELTDVGPDRQRVVRTIFDHGGNTLEVAIPSLRGSINVYVSARRDEAEALLSALDAAGASAHLVEESAPDASDPTESDQPTVLDGPTIRSTEASLGIALELERLAALHERGVLSAEEFERAKKRVLDA